MIFSQLYNYFARRRPLLFGGLFVITGLAVFGISARINLQEDIAAMLPDDGSSVAKNFALLQRAPFTRKVMINIQADSIEQKEQLFVIADRIAGELQSSPYFTHIMTGVNDQAGLALMEYLSNSLPNLTTTEDVTEIKASLTPDAIKEQLSASKRLLISPEGLASKKMIIEDPLDLRRFSLRKMKHIGMIPNMRLENGHFVSKDGLNALLIAETAIPMTDSKRGRQMIDHFNQTTAELPAGLTATMLCSHRYTVANAESIQNDLKIILTATTVGIFALFVVFLRCWRALYAFLLPAFVLIFAVFAVSMTYSPVSAVTIGFGAVLLGISVDFALHMYFALREKGEATTETVLRLTPPLLFCGLTTVGAFAVMFISDLPGQRQLALFSVVGIIASLLLSLLVLPHLVGNVSESGSTKKDTWIDAGRRLPRYPTLAIWLLVLVTTGVFAKGLSFSGKLNNLHLIPEDIRHDENLFKETWGDFRGQALVFSEGKDLQKAMEVNDELFRQLSKNAQLSSVSFAPILPSTAAQQTNAERWKEFWDTEKASVQKHMAANKWPAKATAAFEKKLEQPAKFSSLATLRDAGLGAMINSMIIEEKDRTLILTMVLDTPDAAAFFEKHPQDNVHFVSQTQTANAIGAAINRDFYRFISLAMAVIVVLVTALFRDAKKVLFSLAPVFTGLIGMFGVMAMCGLQMNLFNVIATILIIGLGVDYGIFMIHKMTTPHDRATSKAVLVSGLTTLVGFGALTLGEHPALRSIGLTVGIGISFAIATALFVIPAIYPQPGKA